MLKNAATTVGLFWVLTMTAIGAINVSDLGVPSGLTAEDYDNRGNDLLNKGDYANARRYLTAAVRAEPGRWSAYFNRAMTYYLEKNWPAALADLNTTIRLQPAYFEASWERSRVHHNMGNDRACLSDLDALERATSKVQNIGELMIILNQRAWLRATSPDATVRNGPLAVKDATRACDYSHWHNSHFLDTLAAAYAQSGDFQKAAQYEEQAIKVCESGTDEGRGALKYASPRVQTDMGKGDGDSLPGYIQRAQSYRHHQTFRAKF